MTSPTNTTVKDPPQLSEAVTLPGLGGGTDSAQETVTGAGQEIVGTDVSFTVII
ncbi:hypothetical protein MASR1M65_11480 [Saprospiraceae bacterium]